MDVLAIINGALYLLNMALNIATKKWTAVMGWFCAFVWVIIYLLK